jgi:hypothetical protein
LGGTEPAPRGEQRCSGKKYEEDQPILEHGLIDILRSAYALNEAARERGAAVFLRSLVAEQ